MANSNITRCALATALKDMMAARPFSKITVADICGKCGMNRKSFYYHFRDKYELLNWIFNHEFLSRASLKKPSGTDALYELCEYLYDNREFYRHAFRVEGTNCFSDYFCRTISSRLNANLRTRIETRSWDEFTINLFSDGFTCAIERWILDPQCMPPDKFVDKILDLITFLATRISR